MADLKRALIMAGGTGGHVFPGLALAQYMRTSGIDVHWLGTCKGMEVQLVSQAGFPIHFIQISGVRGKPLKEKILFPWRLIVGLVQAMQIIHRLGPDLVIGMGGFVSGPGGIASWALRKKLVIHEQNAKPGSTNRWLAKLASKVIESFPDTFPKNNKVITIGNPVREEITRLASPAIRLASREGKKHLLVLGGSLGAQAINQLLPQALSKLSETLRPAVWHQTGEKHFSDTVKAYEKIGITVKIEPFIAEMSQAYQWADIALCRAGALTISELCTVGLGAVLVPFPYAVDDHQTANADYMAGRQAALIVQQRNLTEDALAGILSMLCLSTEKCMAMAKAAYGLRKMDVAREILDICREVCH